MVILSAEDYIEEAMRQLNDINHYKQLPSNPTMLHCSLVNNTIEHFKKDGTLAEGLKPHFSTYTKDSQGHSRPINYINFSTYYQRFTRTFQTYKLYKLFYLLPKIHKDIPDL